MSTFPYPVSAGSQPAIHTMNLTKVYGSGEATVVAVNNVNIDIRSEEFTALMGPSGSGKSTFLHCVAGLDGVTSGKVIVGGEDITAMNDTALSKFRRDRIGYVFQSFNLLPTMNARQNIELPLRMSGARIDSAWFDQLITNLGLADRLHHFPHELSGGQQQRVAVARALLSRPAVVIADEPTGNLDSVSSKEVLGLLRSAVDELGQTVLMVTHDSDAAAVADRIIRMEDGNIVSDSVPATR
ncbi:ABC transporter ATP-binding protein [Trueperella sp. LYQ141]|uniref:ABC transporter ATP-binding protein n=1 Tax=Trueperella sp. LYQ141 TaxID=3391058 RepID=UPI003983D147